MQNNRPQSGRSSDAVTRTRRVAAAKKNNSVIHVVILIAVIALIVFIASLFVLGGMREENKLAEESIREQEAENSRLASMLLSESPAVPLETEIFASYTADTKLITEQINSEYAILIDVADNTVVAHKNGEARIFPASMTKVMTMIVAAENIEDFNKEFTFTYHITDPAYEAGASIAGFLSSETVPLIDIMYGIALPSGADATTAIAIEVAGSEEAFVGLMNKKAEEMGLVNTHFENASGLHHPDHYTTPHEMAIIMEYAMGNPFIAKLMSTDKYVTTATPQHPEGITLVSTLFGKLNQDGLEAAEVIAGKTGYTLEAKRCLASMAERADGRRYILVTAYAMSNTVSDRAAINDAVTIYKNYIPVPESAPVSESGAVSE